MERILENTVALTEHLTKLRIAETNLDTDIASLRAKISESNRLSNIAENHARQYASESESLTQVLIDNDVVTKLKNLVIDAQGRVGSKSIELKKLGDELQFAEAMEAANDGLISSEYKRLNQLKQVMEDLRELGIL